MLIKMKLPERKDSPNGMACTCHAIASVECCCGADWADNEPFNEALDLVESLNQPLVRGMEIDVAELTRLIRIQNKCTTDANDKALAVYLKANAHVWLKEVEKGK